MTANDEWNKLTVKFKDTIKHVPLSRRINRRIREGTALWVPLVPVTLPPKRDRATRQGDEVLARYQDSSVTEDPNDFVLYRIIGNDLPPLHEVGQARRNLEFILENEPNFPDCDKRFLLNRIIDNAEEQKIIDMLKEANARYLRIPFSLNEYRHLSSDLRGVPERYRPHSRRYKWLRSDQRLRVQTRLYRHKNNYVMNNNGARNVALSDGRRRAKWVLPWDGNCFLTPDFYEAIREDVKARPHVPYKLVRMVRVRENSEVFKADILPKTSEEPQIIFRRDAVMEFDPAFWYGRRPKVELLWRLGVPGPWDEWGIEPWDLPCPAEDEDAGGFNWAGDVVRLSLTPGNKNEKVPDGTQRMDMRNHGIIRLLNYLDKQAEESRRT